MGKGGVENMKLTLKACRINVKASVKEMAAAVGVSEDSIYKWENGKCAPRGKHMIKILDFFEQKGFPIQIDEINFLP